MKEKNKGAGKPAPPVSHKGNKMKFTKFEQAEIRYKLEVIRDEEEMLQDIGKSKLDIDALIEKVKSNGHLDKWEVELIVDEVENLLDIAEVNHDAGFSGYYNDIRKLRKLLQKIEAAQ